MLRSMTGYGRETVAGKGYSISVEMRSLNHRYLSVDVSLEQDTELLVLKEKIRQHMQNRIRRGRVEIKVKIEGSGVRKRRAFVNEELARSYLEALDRLQDIVNSSSGIDLATLSVFPGVIEVRETGEYEESLWKPVRQALEGALARLEAMRCKEGAALKRELVGLMSRFESLLGDTEELLPGSIDLYRERLQRRISSLIADEYEVDQEKLSNEVARTAEKCDATEEIARIKSHIEQFSSELEEDGPHGKKLDFILQELQREVNTISAKTISACAGRKLVELKAIIDQLREQVQNVE